MSSIEWMEAEAYALADRFNEDLDKAYKQGVQDAWNNAKMLWENGTFSVEWSADEMMLYAEKELKKVKDVEKLAEEMGIDALYALVSTMKGEEQRTEDDRFKF